MATQTVPAEDQITFAEAVLSMLIGTGQIDETNPQLLRSYAKKAEAQFGVSALDFYTTIYLYTEDVDYDLSGYAGSHAILDSRVEALMG